MTGKKRENSPTADPREPVQNYLAWNSLLQKMEHGEFTMAALTDERQLYEESIAMMHGVAIYGERCSRGISRIFRICRSGKHIATGEIGPKDGAWTVLQARGPSDGRVDEATADAMRATARAYTQAWQREQENPNGTGHAFWRQDKDGREIPETREAATMSDR